MRRRWNELNVILPWNQGLIREVEKPTKAERMTVSAIKKFGDRLILVKNGPPLEIAYSDDDGRSYSIVRIGDEGEYIDNTDCLLIAQNLYLFLATSKSRIFRSIDYGATWHVVEDGVVFATPFIRISESDGIIFAATEIGIIKSLSNGDYWEMVEMPSIWLQGDEPETTQRFTDCDNATT